VADTDTGTRPLNGIAQHAAAEDFVRFFAEGWAQPKPEVFLEHFRPRFHPDAHLVQPTLPPATGLEEIETRFRELFALFPDYLVKVDDWANRGDVLFIEVTHSVTVGGRVASWPGVDRIVLEDGLLRERVAYFDSVATMPAAIRAPRTWPALVRWSMRSASRRRAP
jgi:hypothetical protein